MLTKLQFFDKLLKIPTDKCRILFFFSKCSAINSKVST